MENLKKSVVQPAKVFKQLNGEFNKTNNDLNVKIVDNYLLPVINLYQILTKRFGLRIG
jgi:hypothetical protein